MTVNPIPPGYHTVTPYLVVDNPDQLISFLEAAFGAKIGFCMRDPSGRTKHAEIQIGDSKVMMGAAQEANQVTKSMLYLYVKDTDAYYRQALAAGATSIAEPDNKFYGDRNAAVQDAFGNQWWLATHVEDVSMEELKKRAAALHQSQG